MATYKAKDVAGRVSDAILYHRDSVPGKNSDSPHLYNQDVSETSDGGMIVKFWSSQGFFHDCWITARVKRNGFVQFQHCGDKGMKQLVRLIRDEL